MTFESELPDLLEAAAAGRPWEAGMSGYLAGSGMVLH